MTSHFRDHADAMRVIGATFAGHALFGQPCQSWMVRRVLVPETGEPLPPASTDILTSSAFHFVVTWLPGRALIVTGDIGAAVYSGITHLADLDETVRLVRGASFGYLTGKSTHQREYDPRRTAELIVEKAYAEMRESFDPEEPGTRRTSLMERIVDWHGGNLHSAGDWTSAHARKAACRELLGSDLSADDAIEIADNWEICCQSWPAQSHWHYEALRTWANLMCTDRAKAKAQAARDAITAQQQLVATGATQHAATEDVRS